MKKKSNFKKIEIGESNKIVITKKNKLKRISNEKNFLEGYFYEINNLMWDEMRKAVKDIKIIKKGKKISNDMDIFSEESEINSYNNRNFQVFWEEASAAYTEINMPLGTFIKEKEVIIAIVTELGYKAMIKLDILNFTIHNFVEILNKFKDKGKIEIKAFCAKKIEIPYNIKNMKNIKKIDIEDGIVVISEEDRNCIINVDKVIRKILEKYEIGSAEIIEYSDEDIHNLLMFL
jgi:hypothetical protein